MSNLESVSALRNKYPCMTGTEIGRRLGISRERVRQLLTSQGLLSAQALSKRPRCSVCGRSQSWYVKGNVCRECSKVTFICSHCGVAFKRSIANYIWKGEHDSKYTHEMVFHNRQCFNNYLKGT